MHICVCIAILFGFDYICPIHRKLNVSYVKIAKFSNCDSAWKYGFARNTTQHNTFLHKPQCSAELRLGLSSLLKVRKKWQMATRSSRLYGVLWQPPKQPASSVALYKCLKKESPLESTRLMRIGMARSCTNTHWPHKLRSHGFQMIRSLQRTSTICGSCL